MSDTHFTDGFKLLIEDTIQSTLTEFIAANFAEDVEQLTAYELLQILNMSIGDIVSVGMNIEIKRVS